VERSSRPDTSEEDERDQQKSDVETIQFIYFREKLPWSEGIWQDLSDSSTPFFVHSIVREIKGLFIQILYVFDD